MKVRDIRPGEWVQPKRRGYRLQCCRCGLVHRWNFRIVRSLNGGRTVEFQLFHDKPMKRNRTKRDDITSDFQRGFERACLLITGNTVKWNRGERRLFNRMTRMLFGKKRRT